MGRVGRDARVVLPVAPVAPVRGSDRVIRWVALVALLLSVAVVKPWVGAGEAATPTEGGTRPDESGAARPDASIRASHAPPFAAGDIDADLVRACLEPATWLVASIVAYNSQTIRIWRALEPSAAGGPSDPAIPIAQVASEGVAELGWCAPVAGPDRPTGQTTVEAWSLHGGTAQPLRLVRTVRTPRPSRFGAMYGPTSAGVGSPASRVAGWPAGRYVFRLGLEAGDERWFGVDLELRPAASTWAPGPSPSAGAPLP